MYVIREQSPMVFFIHVITYYLLPTSLTADFTGFFFPRDVKKKTKTQFIPKKWVSFLIIPSMRKNILLNTYHNKNFFVKYITKFTLMKNFTYPVN